MGERKGTNKYYPPDFDPAKHRSLDGYYGVHPLRERAKKLKTEGILIIRFEMPYNIWCEGCGQPVGMGVRYNAEKTKIGMYYSTPIYQFRMKCTMCDTRYVIKTDPANQDYVITSGARRKEQRWDGTQNEQVVPEEKETHKKLEADPMFALEHRTDDVKKQTDTIPSLERMEKHQEKWKDDYLLNKLARNKFRGEKNVLKSSAATDKTLLEKSSLEITLVPEDKDDIRLAGLLKYQDVNEGRSFEERQLERRKDIESQSLFGSNESGTLSTANKSSKLKHLKTMARKTNLQKASTILPTSDNLLNAIKVKRKTSSDTIVNVTSGTGTSNVNSKGNRKANSQPADSFSVKSTSLPQKRPLVSYYSGSSDSSDGQI